MKYAMGREGSTTIKRNC